MSQPYSLGLIVGRFQVLHAGHQQMISRALSLCDEVCIMVGSSQESGTEKNPLSYEERRQVILTLFPTGVRVYPLPDAGLGNVPAWGEYVLEHVKQCCGRLPDLLITGKEERRVSWYHGPLGNPITELHVPKQIPVSSSMMRAYLLEDKKESWQQFADNRLWPMYDSFRKAVLGARGNTRTNSL